jgi:hypothetical protein
MPTRRFYDEWRDELGSDVEEPDWFPIAERGSVRGMVYHLGTIRFALAGSNGQRIHGWQTPPLSPRSLSRLDPQIALLKDLLEHCMSEDLDGEVQALDPFRKRLELLGSKNPSEIGGVIDAALSRADDTR